jgi:hypothetical protein
VKEAKEELLQSFGRYKSMLAQMTDRGMTAEGSNFWEDKGNVAVKPALEEV